MKAKDMREKSPEDLRELEKSLVRDAFQAKLKNFTNRLDDTSQIRKAKHDLARVKTILGELRRNEGKSEAPAAKASVTSVSGKASAKAAKTSAVKAPSKKKAATSKAKGEAGK
jgi:large subunit ribosomal protein L29